MNRDQKAAVIDEIAADITASQAIFAVDYRGISVAQVKELRERLRTADASFRVVKNSLTERAADKAGVEELKALLVGPTALTFARGDGAAAAKAVADFARTTDLLAFKGGLMDGASLSPAEVGAISRLPSRDVLYGQLVGIVASPIVGLARTLNALIGGLAVGLGAVLEKRSGELPPPSAEVEAATATQDAPADTDAPAAQVAADAEATQDAPAQAEAVADEAAQDAPAAAEAAAQTQDAPAAAEAAAETQAAPAAAEAAAETQAAPAEAGAEAPDAPAEAEADAAAVQPPDESPAGGEADAHETAAPDDEASTPAPQGEPGEDINNESDPGADAAGDDTSKE